jgi:hypothetical protein
LTILTPAPSERRVDVLIGAVFRDDNTDLFLVQQINRVRCRA